jgi:hypothetical protein
MNDNQVALNETMADVQAHVRSWMSLHPDILDDAAVLDRAIAERWKGVPAASVLEQAELNTIAAERNKRGRNPKQNPWVTTEVQGDLFHDVPVKIPSLMMIGGKWRPYTEASIHDGLAFWSSLRQSESTLADNLQEAATVRRGRASEAGIEEKQLMQIIRLAEANGIDTRTLRYAKSAT